MWIYAPIMKLFLNGILFFSIEESSESPKQFILDGLLLSFFIYPTFFLIGLLLDSFRKYYKKNDTYHHKACHYQRERLKVRRGRR